MRLDDSGPCAIIWTLVRVSDVIRTSVSCVRLGDGVGFDL